MKSRGRGKERSGTAPRPTQTLPYRSQVQACGVSVLVPGANPAWGETRDGVVGNHGEMDGGMEGVGLACTREKDRMNVLVYFCPACLSSVILVGEGEKRLQVHANQREAVEPSGSLDSGTKTNWESAQRGFNYWPPQGLAALLATCSWCNIDMSTPTPTTLSAGNMLHLHYVCSSRARGTHGVFGEWDCAFFPD